MPQLSFYSSSNRRNPTARSAPRKVASSIFKKRYRNKRIDSIMKRRPRKTVDRKQTNAIYTLSKQVKKLQFGQYGDRQYQYQYAILQNTVADSQPTLTNPIFFAANAFYNDTPVYRGSVDAAGESHFIQAGTAAIPIKFTKQTFSTDIQNQYQWNEQRNQDTVSKVEYLPIYMKYKFRFMGSVRHLGNTMRYRVTLFKMKKLPITSDKKTFNLPAAAGGYWRLCDDVAENRNYFSKSYHQILADRWITFAPPVGDGDTFAFNKVLEIPYAFSSKEPLKPNLQPDPSGQSFWTNLPQNEIIWCVISTNQESDVTTQPTISIERTLHFRDKHGTTVGLN